MNNINNKNADDKNNDNNNNNNNNNINQNIGDDKKFDDNKKNDVIINPLTFTHSHHHHHHHQNYHQQQHHHPPHLHQIYNKSSSLLLSPKKLSPRSSSHSVSFNIDESNEDLYNNNENNKNIRSTMSSNDNENLNEQINDNELTLPPPPPPLLLSPTSTTMATIATTTTSPSPPPPPPLVTSPQPLSSTSSFICTTTNQSKNQDTDTTGVVTGGAISRTNSSGSIPDYLSHKLQKQINLTSSANLLKSKRKSIAVTSMLRSNDYFNSDTTNFRQKLLQNHQQHQQQQHTPLRMVNESCDSSTSTTTSESYHLNDLPSLPAKLATLSKPPNASFFNSSFRRARHSIDVRALPSYLAKKRQSTFGQLVSVISPTAPDESSSSDDPLFAEPIAPTLSLGERVAWVQSSGPEFGIVRWIGRMPQISNDWTVGIEFDNAIGSGDGTVDGRRYFVAKENFAKFLPISELTKVDNYAGRPRSGTMLSRMSVQLKPGQLISIQRSPTTTVPHCYLNAPHHVGHDVHSPNNRHCQCHSCNHPCAHICKTRKPKGKRWTEDMAHMCHFSSKPHASMCCGGEDLATAFEPIKEPGTSWKHSEVITSLRTVPTEIIHHRKSTITHSSINMHLIKEPEILMKKSSTTKQQILNSSPNNYHHHHHNRERHLDSGLLERTGSDLSISSLPSSSSVAEIYIGRSVLTDESDIDSETERSLDSNVKETNKQGFRSLVACFLANSLRLKSMKSYADKNINNKKNKQTDKSHLRRIKQTNKHNNNPHHHHQHHYDQQQHRENVRKVKKNQQIQRLGLSSTDTSYNVDIANSSVPNTQPNNSLSSDISNHQVNEEQLQSSTLQQQSQQPCSSIQNSLSVTSSTTISTAFSPRYHQSNSKTNFYATKNSPYHISEMNQHHIDGHISEEITNSSSSSTQRNTRTESSDKRTSNYTSSENFQSPRRRRNKGPAPKPPKNDKNNQQQQQNEKKPTECSSSPLSINDAVSTTYNSFSNSSLSTTNSSTKAQVILTKSPLQQPPNLVRSLSEQKQLNMKNLINALPSFRSEVNLQEIKNESECNNNNNNNSNNNKHVINKDDDNDKNIESIYEIPLCGKNLINNKDILLPILSEKTFDPVKVFGCAINFETKKLESNSIKDNQQQQQQPSSSSPNNICRSKSMPFAKYTCCIFHWKEYLATTTTTTTISSKKQNDNNDCTRERELCNMLLLDELCDCKNDTGLIDALLSPKHQHNVRFRKSDFDINNSILINNKNNNDELNNNNHNDDDDDDNIDNLLNEMNNFELIRVMSDSSLTNTTSATTVVEYIHNDDNGNDNGSDKKFHVNNKNNNNNETISNSKDVFCQTSFKNSPEKFSRRCCKHKHFRCRTLRYRNHRKDCRHQYSCTLHNNECCSINNNPLYLGLDKKFSNVWLTSSTSDHSLSSLSSSNSTLSETPSAIRNANEIGNSNNHQHHHSNKKNQHIPSMNVWTSPLITKFNRPLTNINIEKYSKKILSDELIKDSNNNRSTIISNDKLFKNSNGKNSGNMMQTFPINNNEQFSESTIRKFTDYISNFNDEFVGNNNNKNDYSWSQCLLSQLEMAIANGDHQKAAIIAKELAFKKVNCCLTGKFSSTQCENNIITGCDYPIVTYLYIEDKLSHKGPIPFQLYPSMTVKMLKIKVEKEFDIPSELQQWIFDKNLALNMDASLLTYGVTHSGCSILLQIKTLNENEKIFNLHQSTILQSENNKLINENVTTNVETNGDIFDKDDDNIFESLKPTSDDHLPPYSSMEELSINTNNNNNNKIHIELIDDEKLSSINYIQNPLASLDFDAINAVSSCTSFNETIHTISTATTSITTISTTTTTINNEQNFSTTATATNSAKKIYNYQDIEQPPPYHQKELVFESLNFVNELLPRVEEENEDEIEEEEEEYDDDVDDEINDNTIKNDNDDDDNFEKLNNNKNS